MMQVQSPVGTFPLRVAGVRLQGGSLKVDTYLGAWRSEVTLDRRDARLAAAAFGFLALVFVLGRRSAR
jgi:hypothetical protein